MFQAELFTVSQEAQEIARIASAGHDQNLLNPRIHQSLNRIVDHRPVVNRQQMLVSNLGEREKTASRTASQYDAFHRPLSYRKRPPRLASDTVRIRSMELYNWEQLPAEQMN